MQQRLQGRTLDQTYLYHSEHWRSAAGYVTRFVFAYTDDDVAQLNADLRSVRKATGELGEDHEIDTAHGRHAFAVGDRIQFTATDKKQGIVNGAAGTIEAINGTNLEVRLDGREPKTINFDAANFDQFRHGYAGTIYRGQPVAAGQRLQRRIRAAMKNPIWKWSAAVGGSTAFVWLALLAGTISVALCHGALVVAETTPGCE